MTLLAILQENLLDGVILLSPMRFLVRTISLASVCAAIACHAQITGPLPLAWRWAQPTAAAPGGPPIVLGDRVALAVGGRMYCVEVATGNQVWRYPAGEPLPGNFRTGAAVAGDIIVGALDSRVVYAADVNTGQGQWQFRLPAQPTGQPIVAGKTVLFQLADSTIVALDAESGQPIWERLALRIEGGILGQIGAFRDTLLVFTQDAKLLAYRTTTPDKPLWQVKFSTLSPDVRPVILGDTLFVNTGPYLAALTAASGMAKWSRNTGMDLDRNPAVSGSAILVVTRDGTAMSYDLMGRPILKKPVSLGASAAADPSAVGNLMVVPTANGSVVVIDPKTGVELWNYIVRPLTAFATGSTNTSPYVPLAQPAVLSGQTLLLLAADGSLLAFDDQLGVDLTAPQVELLWPAPGDQISGQPPLRMVFKITDETSGVNMQTVKFTIDGVPYKFDFRRDGYLLVDISESGGNKPLRDGRRVLSVTVSDWLGNTREAKFALTIDNSLSPLGAPKSGEASAASSGGGPTTSGTGGRGGGGTLGGGG